MSPRVAPGSIIVGVDGSEHAERALRWAAEQAHLEHRPLVAVVAAGGRAGAQKTTEAAVRIVRGLRPDVDVTGLAALGDTRDILLDLAP